MNIETILSALELNCWNRHNSREGGIALERGLRQYKAYRARIIKMFEEKDEVIKYQDDALEIAHQNGVSTIAAKDARIAELDKENEQLVDLGGLLSEKLAAKDARIAELKAENQAMEYLLNEGENIGVE